MKFVHATLMVKNMEESLKFYQEILDLKIHDQIKNQQGPEILFLGEEETKIELIHDKHMQDIDMGQSISLGFQVESLDRQMAFLKEKGIDIHSGPFQPNPNTRFFYILDPNGLKIQFIEIK